MSCQNHEAIIECVWIADELDTVTNPCVVLCSVVAVHDIGAEPDCTWMANGINWLKDGSMLPHDIPNARIMRFGYEPQWLSVDSVQQRLSLVADQLLHSLDGFRTVCIIQKHIRKILIFKHAELQKTAFNIYWSLLWRPGN